MKDVEKMKIQLQQLQDTKARYSEQVQDLSKQLRDAKKVNFFAVMLFDFDLKLHGGRNV